jgi:hypothetical protein
MSVPGAAEAIAREGRPLPVFSAVSFSRSLSLTVAAALSGNSKLRLLAALRSGFLGSREAGEVAWLELVLGNRGAHREQLRNRFD